MKFKNHILPFLAIYILILLGSCTAKIFEDSGDNRLQRRDTLQLANDRVYENYVFDFNIASTQKFSITRYPNWMKFNSLEGILQRGKAIITFSTRNIPSTAVFGKYTGQLDFYINEYGTIRYIVKYENYGAPKIELSTGWINAGFDTEKEFTIRNTSNGLLYWLINNAPGWVLFSKMNGSLKMNESVTIKVFFRRTGMITGNYREKFEIVNNSTSEPVEIHVEMEVKN
jgi:hypothetical protein